MSEFILAPVVGGIKDLRIKLLLIVLFVLQLAACGGGQRLDLPAERPGGKISGNVLGGLYTSGTISAYTLDEGANRQFIASSAISEKGEFKLEFASTDKPVLLEAKGGSFIDPNSLATINPEPEFILSSIVMYKSGQDHAAILTPITHLVSGLVFYNKENTNSELDEVQLGNAYAQFKNLYAVNLNNKSLSISYQQDPKLLTFEGEEKHGLVINGLSLLANKLGADKQEQLKQQFNLSTLTALMYEDIRADGLLNGKSVLENDNVQKSLSFAGYPIDFNFYRTNIADASNKALEYSSFSNFTSKASQQQFIYQIATANSVLLADKNSDAIKNAKPEIILLNDLAAIENGSFAIDVVVKNILELKEIYLQIDDLEINRMVNPIVTSFSVNSSIFTDGVHQIKIVATDNYGNEGIKQIEVTFDNTAPLLTVLTQPKAVESGEFIINFTAEDIAGLQQIKLIVGDTLVATVENPEELRFVLDTTAFEDGVYPVTIVAIDSVGYESRQQMNVSFDNSAPMISITSSTIVGVADYLLEGEYNEQFSQINKLTVNGESVTLDGSGKWTYAVVLNSGLNEFVIGAEDIAGNYDEINKTIVLDDQPPVIQYLDPIDTAFSNNDGTFVTGKLELINSVPLYINVRKLSLSGTIEDRASLSNADIPFFEFAFNDFALEGYESPADDRITVHYRYLINDVEVLEWQERSISVDNNQIILPLASETLSNAWYKTTVNDRHKLEVRATDAMQNQTIESVEFQAQFYVPDVNVTVGIDQSDLDLGSFVTRAEFVGADFYSNSYVLHNDIGRDYRIKLQDTTTHTVIQEYDTVLRVNKVQKRSTESWRRSTITDLSVECPTLNNDWQAVSKLWNYINRNWVEVTPKSTNLEEVDVFSDNPTLPASTEWTAYQAADEDFYAFTSALDGEILSYYLDYLFNYDTLSFHSSSSQPGMTINWSLKKGKRNIDCPDIFALQTRFNYDYLPVEGFPKNTLSSDSLSHEFNSSNFQVIDEDGSEILADNGWHLIPAGHTVIIKKIVNVPAFSLFTDKSVEDSTTIKDYNAHKLDKRFIWNINQGIVIDTQFNPEGILTGESNSKRYEFVFDAKIVHFQP